MSLERIKGQITFTCDGPQCYEFLDAETGDFEAALLDLQEAGWKAQPVGRDWFHYCPDCSRNHKPDFGKLMP